MKFVSKSIFVLLLLLVKITDQKFIVTLRNEHDKDDFCIIKGQSYAYWEYKEEAKKDKPKI